jgi:hypothetical protein
VHEVELSRRPLEVPRPNGIGHRFEIAQRLEGHDLEPEIDREKPRIARFAAEEGQIILEDLDSAKAGLGRGGNSNRLLCLCFPAWTKT